MDKSDNPTITNTIVIRQMEDSFGLNPRKDSDPFGRLYVHKGGQHLAVSARDADFDDYVSIALESAFENLFPWQSGQGHSNDNEEIPSHIDDDGEEALIDNPLYFEPGIGLDIDEMIEAYQAGERWARFPDRLVFETFTVGDGYQAVMFADMADIAEEHLNDRAATDRLTPEIIESARDRIKAEIKLFTLWAEGSLYEFSVYEPGEPPEDGVPDDEIDENALGEEIDACCGFFSEHFGEDFVANGMADHWPDDWRTTHRIIDESGHELYNPATDANQPRIGLDPRPGVFARRTETPMTDLPPQEMLDKGIHTNDVAMVDRALDRGADPNEQDQKGWTPLMHAVRVMKNPRMIKSLSDAGASFAIGPAASYDPTRDKRLDCTAASLAISASDTVFDKVMAHCSKEDLNVEMAFGATPATLLADEGRVLNKQQIQDRLIKMLDAGADFDITNDEGESVTTIARNRRLDDLLDAVRVKADEAGLMATAPEARSTPARDPGL